MLGKHENPSHSSTNCVLWGIEWQNVRLSTNFVVMPLGHANGENFNLVKKLLLLIQSSSVFAGPQLIMLGKHKNTSHSSTDCLLTRGREGGGIMGLFWLLNCTEGQPQRSGHYANKCPLVLNEPFLYGFRPSNSNMTFGSFRGPVKTRHNLWGMPTLSA